MSIPFLFLMVMFSYCDHGEDVDHFYPPLALRHLIQEGIGGASHPDIGPTRSLPANIPSSSRLRRKFSDFDDTWSRPYKAATAAAAAFETSAIEAAASRSADGGGINEAATATQASPSSSRQISVESDLLFNLSPSHTPSEAGTSREETSDGGQEIVLVRDLNHNNIHVTEEDEESIYGDAISRKTSLVSVRVVELSKGHPNLLLLVWLACLSVHLMSAKLFALLNSIPFFLLGPRVGKLFILIINL